MNQQGFWPLMSWYLRWNPKKSVQSPIALWIVLRSYGYCMCTYIYMYIYIYIYSCTYACVYTYANYECKCVCCIFTTCMTVFGLCWVLTKKMKIKQPTWRFFGFHTQVFKHTFYINTTVHWNTGSMLQMTSIWPIQNHSNIGFGGGG